MESDDEENNNSTTNDRSTSSDHDDIKLVELILLYGPPFSGKTHYCEKYIFSFFSFILFPFLPFLFEPLSPSLTFHIPPTPRASQFNR